MAFSWTTTFIQHLVHAAAPPAGVAVGGGRVATCRARVGAKTRHVLVCAGTMKTPPWQPPGRPAPYAPTPPQTAAMPPGANLAAVGPALLRAPLWAPQEGETTAEHCAFLAWLMGGYEIARSIQTHPTHRGDWAAALGVLGGTSAQVHALAVKWSWEVRGREYWTLTRELGLKAVEAHTETVLEFAALSRERDRLWLELEILELKKATNEAKRIVAQPGQDDHEFCPRLFSNRELVALYRASGALEIQRFRAGVLDRAKGEHDDETVTDWAQLPPADLEAYRQLREKARLG